MKLQDEIIELLLHILVSLPSVGHVASLLSHTIIGKRVFSRTRTSSVANSSLSGMGSPSSAAAATTQKPSLETEAYVSITVRSGRPRHAVLFRLAECLSASSFLFKVRFKSGELTKSYMRHDMTIVEVKYSWWLDEWLKFDHGQEQDFAFLCERLRSFPGPSANCVVRICIDVQ